MAYVAPSNIMGHHGNELAEALESVVGEELRLIAEYDARAYDILYVSGDLVDDFGGLDAIRDQAEDLFPFYHLDFLERDLIEDMLCLGEVGTYVTFMDHGIVIRAQRESVGVFVITDVSASVDDIQITIQNTLPH